MKLPSRLLHHGRHRSHWWRMQSKVPWHLPAVLLAIVVVTSLLRPVQWEEPALFHTAKITRKHNVRWPSVEIISASKSFNNSAAVATRYRAIQSWLALSPKPRVTLVGREGWYLEAAKKLGLRVVTGVDMTFLGRPIFSSLLSVANRSTADVVVVINEDTFLYDDFLQTVYKAHTTFDDYLLVATRYNVDTLPEALPTDSKMMAERVRQFVDVHGTLQVNSGVDVWVWNTGGARLFNGAMPSFVYGEGTHSEWFVHEASIARRRELVDITETCLAVQIGGHSAHASALSKRNTNGSFGALIRTASSPSRNGGSRQGSSYSIEQETESILESTENGDENLGRTRAVGGVERSDGVVLQGAAGYLRSHSTNLETLRRENYLEMQALHITADADTPGHASQSREPFSYSETAEISGFEQLINKYLGYRAGTFRGGNGTTSQARWMFSACHEPSSMCLVRRTRPRVGYGEYSDLRNPALSERATDEVIPPTGYNFGQMTKRMEILDMPVELPEGYDSSKPFGLPLTVHESIARVAINNTVIISALNFGYRSLMMNWVCNMRRLYITNFVIAALDPDLYKYAYSKGIATYYENTFDKRVADEAMQAEGSYGSVHFKKITKMKTQVVARILKLGFNVVWSDCDIIFFKNPLQYLWSQNADLVIQSNAPDNEKANDRGRINSGFYLVRSTPGMIRALDEVIRFALKSRKSEQPCFYHVLCGPDQQYTVSDNMCEYKGVLVKLLDRSLFPNGGTQHIWESKPGTIPVLYPRLYILHNNWVVGIKGKSERIYRHGFVMFDSNEQICQYEPFRAGTLKLVTTN